MPCCHKEGASMQYCRRCLEIICVQSPVGVGRCPTCRSRFTIENGQAVKRDIQKANCRACRQFKVIVDRNMCDACLFGSLFIFRYECDSCHHVQQIPHPMWRYQPKCDVFGDTTWACRRCDTYTHWRIVPDDLALVPLDDVPASWDVGVEGLVPRVRRMRQEEQAARVRAETDNAEDETGGDVCSIS